MSATPKAWISAMRLRTLPLAASSILMCSFLAAQAESYQWPVLVLALLSAFALQILSNLANDYGDFMHGADHDGRIGPDRALQSGAISAASMRMAIVIVGWISFAPIALLSFVGTRGLDWWVKGVFVALGLLCILAATNYTSGPKPYGYYGFGDIAVFIFFGLCGVLGTYFLHTHALGAEIILPAITLGCFSTAVLNINNLRDIESDAQAGKNTLVVKMGAEAGRWYHLFLLFAGWGAAAWYILKFSTPGAPSTRFLFLAAAPFMLFDGVLIFRNSDARSLDPFLKKLAIGTFCFSVMFGSCIQCKIVDLVRSHHTT